MNIAICDDNKYDINELKNKIVDTAHKRKIENIVFSEFVSGEEILDEYQEGLFDIVFMDIEMNGQTGIEAANEIRHRDDMVIIVFVTSHHNYAARGYESRALRYICKDEYEELIQKYLNEVFDEYLSSKYTIRVISNRRQKVLPIRKIKYACIKHRIITLYAEEGEYNYYGKINDLYKQLRPYFFEKIHRSILVNLRFVKSINDDTLFLDDGTELLISRSERKRVKESYLDSLMKK